MFPKGYLVTSGDSFVVMTGDGGCYWHLLVESRDVSQHPNGQYNHPHPHATKIHPIHNVCSAEAEKACFTLKELWTLEYPQRRSLLKKILNQNTNKQQIL